MIEYIKGILADLNPTTAVVEAAGIGYSIAITLPGYSALVGSEDKEVKLFITEIIREDTHELYGFTVTAERQLFELLMTVSGVGDRQRRRSCYCTNDHECFLCRGTAYADCYRQHQSDGEGQRTRN